MRRSRRAHSRLAFAAMLAAGAVAIAAARAPEVPAGAGRPSLGTNLNWCTDWDPEKLPADLAWSARPWALGNGNGDDPARWAPIDARGWPVVPPGTTFGAVFEAAPFPGTYRLSFTNRAPGSDGDTVTSYSGNIQLQGRRHDATTGVTRYDVVVPSFAPDQFIWLRWAGTTGGVTDVHLMRPRQDGRGWHEVGTPLSDVVVDRLRPFTAIRPMQAQGGASGKVVGRDTTWSDRTSPWGSQQRSRGSPGHFGGVAIENLVAMANQARKDLWINVPFLADDDYITRLARAIRNGTDGFEPYASPQPAPVFAPLAPGLKLYVEFANELWNPGAGYWEHENEEQAKVEVAAGDPLRLDAVTGEQGPNDSGVPGWGWRRTGFLAVRTSLLFREVFGDEAMMTRVRPVLATQHGRYGTTLHPLRYVASVWGPRSPFERVGAFANPRRPVSYYLFGLATAPYVPAENGTLDPASPETLLSSTLAQMSEDRPGEVLRALRDNARFAARHGLAYLAYEGGNNLVPKLFPGGATPAAIDAARQASFDADRGARMGARLVGGLPAADQSGHVYGTLLQTWREAGGGLFVHFTLGEVADEGSMYGLCPPTSAVPGADPAAGRSTSDCRHEAGPRWDALKAFARDWSR